MTRSVSARRTAAAVATGLLLSAVPGVVAASSADAAAAATRISIHTSKRVYVAGQQIRVGVHLNIANAKITYYEQYPGGRKRAIFTGRTDRYGNSHIHSTAKHPARFNTTFYVRYAGSSAHRAAAAATRVAVRVRMGLRVAGYYATKAGYRLYKSPRKLFSTVSLAPSKAGKSVRFRVQRKYGGAWHNLQVRSFRIGRKSTETITFSGVVGRLYRLRAEYPGDRLNAGNATGFTYARFTR